MQQCDEFIAALVKDYEVTVAPVSSKATPADGHETETRKEQRCSVLMLFCTGLGRKHPPKGNFKRGCFYFELSREACVALTCSENEKLHLLWDLTESLVFLSKIRKFTGASL